MSPASARADRAARAAIAARLAAAGVVSPEADARRLLAEVAPDRLEEAVARRAARQPLQLIVGTVGFRYLELAVAPGVFIPRPETEVLAGEAIARCPAGGLVVEPCTGSGAVACSVAHEARPARVLASDADPAAVTLARANAARLGLAVEVTRGDLAHAVPEALAGAVDVLVANPPYVADDELAALPPEVADHDPPAALRAGPTGHEATDALIALARASLAPGGHLLLETDERRAAETAVRARRAGLSEAVVLADLTGRDRVVAARQPPRRGPATPPPAGPLGTP